MKTLKPYLFLLLFLATGPANSENPDQGGYPVYNETDGILTMPRIDVPDQVSRFQDVVFRYDAQVDAWILDRFQLRDSPFAPAIRIIVPPGRIESQLFPTIPVKETVVVEGRFTCGRIGQINQRRTGHLIEIRISQDPLRPDEVCDRIPRSFTRTIKIDTDRLETGEYQIKVNNDIRGGSFIIASDTRQTEECGGSPENDDPNCGLRFPGASTPVDYVQGGYPAFSVQDSTLTLPRVDTPDQVGRYQNVVMRFDSPRDAWILESFDSRNNTHHSPGIKFVDSTVTVVNVSTAQVTLYVSGVYTCGRIGQINQRRSDDLFEIQITLDPLQPDEVCDQITRNFIRVIQLDTFRLEAGEYRFAINSSLESEDMTYSGIFTLPIETFPVPNEECGGDPEDDDSGCFIPW